NASAAAPSREGGSFFTRTQSTPTVKVVPSAGAPVTTFVTSKVAQWLGSVSGGTSWTLNGETVTVQLGAAGAPAPAALVPKASPAAAVLIANMLATIPRTTLALVMIPAPSPTYAQDGGKLAG